MTGMGVVVLLAGGGLAVYLGSQHAARPDHDVAALSLKVLKVQTIGLIDYGPDDDGDQSNHDADDHPLMLRLTGAGLAFVPIPKSELIAGVPLWTADQMADGSEIFIYIPTGRCLTAARGTSLGLAHCDLGLSQRWRPVHLSTVAGQPIAQFATAAGNCLAAGAHAGPARLAPCGPARTKPQEIAFWWSA
ncbi:MAG TPA: hypothetical protein VN840_19010 [Streptosporangiaceae bacterium]|nr:hypothetical protein [Streptosporangiaceae bacterium]